MHANLPPPKTRLNIQSTEDINRTLKNRTNTYKTTGYKHAMTSGLLL